MYRSQPRSASVGKTEAHLELLRGWFDEGLQVAEAAAAGGGKKKTKAKKIDPQWAHVQMRDKRGADGRRIFSRRNHPEICLSAKIIKTWFSTESGDHRHKKGRWAAVGGRQRRQRQVGQKQKRRGGGDSDTAADDSSSGGSDGGGGGPVAPRETHGRRAKGTYQVRADSDVGSCASASGASGSDGLNAEQRAMVGRLVRCDFGDDEEEDWYEGEVVRAFMDSGSVRYRVEYSDQDEFEYSGEELERITI
jgi:hypothetical protein